MSSIEFLPEFRRLLIHVINLNVYGSAIRYRVQVSNDSGFAGVETLTDEDGNAYWTVAAGAADWQTLCDCWQYVRVQIVLDTAPNVENVRCIITGG